MNSAPNVYTVPFGGIVTAHFPTPMLFVRDDADDQVHMQVHARVRSGDYFMTVATELEEVAHRLTKTSAAEANDLERIVAELLVVAKSYTVTHK